MTEPGHQAASSPDWACPQPSAFDEAMASALTRVAFPEFWFSQLTHRRCPSRWVAVCKDNTTAGLYAVITADVNVLTAVLTLDRAWRIGHGQPGAHA